MANVMKMAIIEAIQSLRSAGLSCRAIARRLGIHRDTVARHVRVGRASILTQPGTAIWEAWHHSRPRSFVDRLAPAGGGRTALGHAQRPFKARRQELSPRFPGRANRGSRAQPRTPPVSRQRSDSGRKMGASRSEGLESLTS